MVGRKAVEIPAELSRAATRFMRWRQSRRVGARIPEPMWRLAVELAARFGVSRTSAALRVSYYSLKKRLESRVVTRSEASPVPVSSFVELAPSTFATPNECIVEFEKTCGTRMRIQLKGNHVPDLAALSRSFWEAE